MNDPVLHAIERWAKKGMIGPEVASTLSAEASEWAEHSGSRSAQYAVATAGAVVAVIAAATFLSWAWPSLENTTQAVVLALVGIVLQFIGLRVEGRTRWRPVGYLLQAAGLAILLIAVVHSERAWSDGSPIAMLFGAVALITPLVMIPVTAPRNTFMPAVHTAFGYAFLYLFLDRALGMDWEEAIWILDVVMIASLVVFAVRFRRDPKSSAWAVGALVAGLFAGMLLILMTCLGPLNLDEDAILGVDLWYCVILALTLWGIHQPDPDLKRTWYPDILGWLVLLSIPLGYATTMGWLNVDDVIAAVVQAAIGGFAVFYGLNQGFRNVTYTGCAVLVVAAFVFGVEASGAIGGSVLALAFSAALLFWVAGRIGKESELHEWE